ncbi:MAG: cupin domain-containing protein [Deltaproteobacteria bacterium]|nr:cupin domain-containing protein [Deltaproteobacteria bacterium]
MEQQLYDEERCFVRGIGSKGYSLEQELKRLRGLPRVIKASDCAWRNGPQRWNKNMMNPGNGMIQSLHCSQEELSPGGRSQKHGHQNAALLYVVEGQGYDIHDGVRYDWNAGDLVLVTPGCVHQHFNALPDRPARVLIIKAKPLYIFMNLIFQGFVEKAPKQPVPGWENFKPIDGSYYFENLK